ncbi:MAG: hypothetical protein ACRDRL_19825, partial [Sciscionella sp.]
GGSFVKWENAGQTLEGEIVKVDRDRESDYGPQDVYSFKTDDGVVLVGAQSVLKDKLDTAGAKVGALGGIRFNGLRKTKDGKREYKDYSVVVKTPSLFDGVTAVAADDAPPF